MWVMVLILSIVWALWVTVLYVSYGMDIEYCAWAKWVTVLYMSYLYWGMDIEYCVKALWAAILYVSYGIDIGYFV